MMMALAFEGSISLENNGGFSSVRYRFQKIQVKEYTSIVIKLQGDGKEYQFRIKSNSGDYYSYIAPFSTSGEWQEIVIPLKDMYPSGRKLTNLIFQKILLKKLPFDRKQKKGEFKLLIDKIELKVTHRNSTIKNYLLH
jgi:hypothetical protein